MPLCRREAGDRQQPPSLAETVARAHLARVDARDGRTRGRRRAARPAPGRAWRRCRARSSSVRQRSRVHSLLATSTAADDEQRGGGLPLDGRLMHLVLQDEQIAAVQQDAERRAGALHGPLGRIGGRLDVAAPDELGVGRPGEHRHPARPEQDALNGAEPARRESGAGRPGWGSSRPPPRRRRCCPVETTSEPAG